MISILLPEGTFSSATSISGEVEGFYPSDIAGLVWPAVQQNGQGPPMYCKKDLSSTEDQTFSFVSLGSVLQIMFNSTREDVTLKSIEIKDGKKAMSGAFHVDDNGNAVIDATDKARFQMKPSFAEELEKRWMRSGLARQHNLYFDTKDNETARRIRISRLEKEEWQCIYLAVFLKMLYLDYGSTDKQGRRADIARSADYSYSGRANNDVFFTNESETTASPDFTVAGVEGR